MGIILPMGLAAMFLDDINADEAKRLIMVLVAIISEQQK
jgi:hypothetical protein